MSIGEMYDPGWEGVDEAEWLAEYWRRLRATYGDLHVDILEVLHRHDPLRFALPDSPDEYDVETEKILARLPEAGSAETCAGCCTKRCSPGLTPPRLSWT